MQTLLDQVFASPDGAPLRFDLFRPDDPKGVPLVVCLHGGGWISGERSDMHDVAERLAAEGFAAACPDYRLAPLHPYPAAVQDAQEFVRFARRNAKDLQVDADAIASFGNSAGGHLAAMLGLVSCPDSDGVDSRVNAVVDICGITDLTAPHWRQKEHLDADLGRVRSQGGQRRPCHPFSAASYGTCADMLASLSLSPPWPATVACIARTPARAVRHT